MTRSTSDEYRGDLRPDGGAAEQRCFHLALRDPKAGALAGDPETNSRFLFELRVVYGAQWSLDAFVHGAAFNQALMVPEKLQLIGPWCHVAQTFDGRMFRSYVDRDLHNVAEVAVIRQGPGAASVGTRITRRNYFRGAIQKARFIHAALAPEQFMKVTD